MKVDTRREVGKMVRVPVVLPMHVTMLLMQVILLQPTLRERK